MSVLAKLFSRAFDGARGSVAGEAYPVTKLKSPGLMVPKTVGDNEFSVSQHSLVVTLAKASGSIWVPENVDR